MHPRELMTEIKGIMAFLITPFDANSWRRLDEEGIRGNVRFFSEKRVNVLVPCGGLGEITQLTLDDHKMAIKAVVEESSRSLVVPGVGPATKLGITVAKYAETVGADGVLVFPPP